MNGLRESGSVRRACRVGAVDRFLVAGAAGKILEDGARGNWNRCRNAQVRGGGKTAGRSRNHARRSAPIDAFTGYRLGDG